MKKNITKIFSMILSVLILFSCFAVCSFADEEKNDVNLLVIGDSIAAGTTLFNADVQCYGAILANTNGWNYTNYAVPGHTTYAFNSRIHEEEVNNAIAGADIIIVSIGGNNFLLNGLVEMIIDGVFKKDYSKMDEIIEDFKVSFDECIKAIKETNPDAELFVQTLYNPMTGVIGETYAEGLARLNGAYKSYLDENPGAYTLVEVAPLFEGHTEYIAYDYIHPNKNGHIVIAGAYQSKFCEMGLVDTDTVIEPTQEEIMSIDWKKYFEDLWFQFTNAVNLIFGGMSNG